MSTAQDDRVRIMRRLNRAVELARAGRFEEASNLCAEVRVIVSDMHGAELADEARARLIDEALAADLAAEQAREDRGHAEDAEMWEAR